MYRVRVFPALCAGAVAVAACSIDESSAAVTDPNTTLPPAVTTTIPPTTTTTTTTALPTTTTTTATTQPPASTTTLPPPSGVPSAAPVPLIAGSAGSGGWLPLGSWSGTAWQPAPSPPATPPPEEEGETPLDPFIAPGTALAIIGLQAQATNGATNGASRACIDLRAGPTVDTPVAVPAPPGFGYSAVALPTPTWPLQPRPVVVITADIPGYQAAGEAAFADAPVDATQGEVEQIVLADLDGDGDEEALVVFEHVDPSAATGAPGDLAAVVAIEGNFVATDAATEPTPITTRYRILDVADLNGDGLMEVVVRRWFFEGAAVFVYSYDGNTFTEALSAGCGT
ncbi:MAG: FG-GAP repeat domain-containing protein [Ilumatobacteraceae bacterium]